MKKILILSFFVFLLAGCSAAPSSINTDKVKGSPPPLGEGIHFLAAGKIDAVSQANILSKISARVVGINADIGSVVQKGDPIILLDKQDIEAQISQAQATVGIAQANLNKVLKGARNEQVEQAKAAYESAKQNYETMQANITRTRDAYRALSISKAELDSAESQFAVASAQFRNAEEQYNLVKKGETSETIQIYEAQLNQANAAFQLAQTGLNNVTLLAPITGRVVAKNIQEGELALPSQVLMTILNTENLVVNAYAPNQIAATFQEGQKVSVKVGDINDKIFEGKVILINRNVEAKSKTVLIKVELSERDPRLGPGMMAEIGSKK